MSTLTVASVTSSCQEAIKASFPNLTTYHDHHVWCARPFLRKLYNASDIYVHPTTDRESQIQGDLTVIHPRGRTTIEVKAYTKPKPTANVFAELLDGGYPGWVQKTRADMLIQMFHSNGDLLLYQWPMFALRDVLDFYPDQCRDHTYHTTNRYGDPKDVLGKLVPIALLNRHCQENGWVHVDGEHLPHTCPYFTPDQ